MWIYSPVHKEMQGPDLCEAQVLGIHKQMEQTAPRELTGLPSNAEREDRGSCAQKCFL